MKITCYIHAQYDEWEKKYEFRPWSIDMSNTPSVGPLVGTHEFDFDPPPDEVLVNGTIQQYRDEQKRILGDAQAQVNALDQKINDLLCLEHKAEAA
jgi:hypothetical protein